MTDTIPAHDMLNACPHCGAPAKAQDMGEDFDGRGRYRIVCSRNGCRDVFAKTAADAVSLWNEPRRP